MSTQKMNVPTGKEVNDGIDNKENAGTTLTGAGIDFMRLVSLKQALAMQKRGMKFSKGMPAATTLARQMLGIKGNLDSLHDQVCKIVEDIQKERDIDMWRRAYPVANVLDHGFEWEYHVEVMFEESKEGGWMWIAGGLETGPFHAKEAAEWHWAESEKVLLESQQH
jgi:hypothetical protein